MAEPFALAPSPATGGFDELLAAAGGALRLVEPLRAVSLRHLREGSQALARTASALGIDALPEPGCFTGSDPRVLWLSPTEWLLLSAADGTANAALAALAPGCEPHAYAVDRSAGLVAFELSDARPDEILMRLIDASAIPREPGSGTRARLGDVAAIVLRIAPDRVWLLAERSVGRYLAQWIAWALDRRAR